MNMEFSRILRAEDAYYFKVFLSIWKLVQAGKPAVIAIDGRCGSGKTGLAALIGDLYPSNVFHMDDFYLPFEQRAQNWMEMPGGNMDLDRFRLEVLLPAGRGETIQYRAFNCQTGRFHETVSVPDRPLTVVEGSYSQHPRLSAQYDLKIFLTCSKEEQSCRLLAREGDRFEAFQTLWMPMEERYFKICGIERSSTLTLDTSGFFDARARK